MRNPRGYSFQHNWPDRSRQRVGRNWSDGISRLLGDCPFAARHGFKTKQMQVSISSALSAPRVARRAVSAGAA